MANFSGHQDGQARPGQDRRRPTDLFVSPGQPVRAADAGKPCSCWGLTRDCIPKGESIPDEFDLDINAAKLDKRPRAVLGFPAPRGPFERLVLHDLAFPSGTLLDGTSCVQTGFGALVSAGRGWDRVGMERDLITRNQATSECVGLSTWRRAESPSPGEICC